MGPTSDDVLKAQLATPSALRSSLLGWGALLGIVVALLTALTVLQPLPPRHLVFATGPSGSGYSVAGQRYRQILARYGVSVDLLVTNGAIDNLARLRSPAVDVGFVQAGTTSESESPHIASLGTVYYSPLWFFCRQSPEGIDLRHLPGRRLSLGPEGSGSRALSLKLLAMNKVEIAGLELYSYPPAEAARKLHAGELDGAFILSGWESPVVQELLSAPGIGLVNFPRADAYLALLPALNKVVVPAGLGDVAENRPPSDVTLLAPKTSLVVRKELHPALQFLLLHAATEIHSGPDAFHRSGQFPAAEVVDLPLSDEARQFFKSGPSLLQRHLPFWLAELVHRLLFILVPLAGILYPLILLFTKGYSFRNRFRIMRIYGELKFLEQGLLTATPELRPALLERLHELDRRVDKLRVPNSHSDLKYTLKSHIVLVRQRVHAAATESP